MFNDLEVVPRPLAIQFMMGMEWDMEPKPMLSELKYLSASADPEARAQAQEMLQKMWFLQPEHSANAETVRVHDLLEMFESFDEPTQTAILKNIVAIECTQGCNGGCQYCFLGEKPRGISDKFSFTSLVAFFTKYGARLQEYAPYRVYPYFNSDLLDYRDGDKTALDVYKLFDDTCPLLVRVLNTSLPVGSQEVFVDLVLEIVDLWKKDRVPPTTINLTISGHTAQRAEFCLQLIENALEQKGLTKVEIDHILKQVISLKFKDMKTGKGLQLVAKLLDRQPEMEDVGSPACLDGVVLSPGNVRSVAMVAATPIHRTGSYDLPVQSGKLFVFDSIWNYLHTESYDSSARSAIDLLIKNQVVFMESIVTHTGEVFGDDAQWTDEQRAAHLDAILVNIAREALAIQYFLQTFTHFCGQSASQSQLDQFVTLAKQRWQEKSIYISQIFERIAHVAIESQQETQVEYSKELHKLLAAKVNLLFDTYDKRGARYAKRLGSVLSHVGARLSTRLNELVSDLLTPPTGEFSATAFTEKYWGDRSLDLKKEIIYDLS